MLKRFPAMFLAFVLAFSLVPLSGIAFAGESDIPNDGKQTVPTENLNENTEPATEAKAETGSSDVLDDTTANDDTNPVEAPQAAGANGAGDNDPTQPPLQNDEVVVAEPTENPTKDPADQNDTESKDAVEGDVDLTAKGDKTTDALHPTPLEAGKYIVRSSISHKRVLDISGGSKAGEANVQLYQSNMTQAQVFEFSFDELGFYIIKNVNSGLVLDVAGASTKAGTNVWQYKANGTKAQKWIITKLSDGSYKIASALKPGLVIDVASAADKDHTNIQMYPSNGTPAQSFVMMPLKVSVDSSRTIADGHYVINSTLSSSLVLDVPEASWTKGVQLQVWTANNTSAQVFEILYQSDGFYTIRTLNSGAYLTVSTGNLVATTPIVQWPHTGKDEQRWAISGNKDGSYTFISKKSGLALSVAGGASKAGTKIETWKINGARAQSFKLVEASDKPMNEGNYSLIPYLASGKRVDISEGSRGNGANAQAYQFNDTMAQKFTITYIAPETYTFQNLNSGHYLAASDGNVVQTTKPKTTVSDAQKWRVERFFGGFLIQNVATGGYMTLTGSGSSQDIRCVPLMGSDAQLFTYKSVNLIITGTHHITTPGGKVIDEENGQLNSGTNIQIWPKNGTAAQKWTLRSEVDEYVSIRCVRSNRVLEIANASRSNGARVKLGDYGGTMSQLWRLIPSGDGWFHLQSRSAMYLATSGNGSNDGEKVQVTDNINNAQKFRFSVTSYSGPPPGTYVDVNLTTQKVKLIKDGVIYMESDVITGAPHMRTPPGTFRILYKQSPATLVGADYRARVTYWMPFTAQGHGLHDASWHSTFGGSLWKTRGSHGCVNMPFWAAEIMYRNVSAGTKVVVHW